MNVRQYIRLYRPNATDEMIDFILWNQTAFPACGFSAYLDRQVCKALGIKWRRKRWERLYKRVMGKKYKYTYPEERMSTL